MRLGGQVNRFFADNGEDDETDWEDRLNQVMASRGRQPNISFCLYRHTQGQNFGAVRPSRQHRQAWPFHLYSMRQAIEEGFILDVLQNSRPIKPISSWSRLWRTIGACRRRRRRGLWPNSWYCIRPTSPKKSRSSSNTFALLFAIIWANTGKAKEEKAQLSEIIDILNNRFGTVFTRKTGCFSSRLRKRLVAARK